MHIEEGVTTETASFFTSHESRIQLLFNYLFKIFLSLKLIPSRKLS